MLQKLFDYLRDILVWLLEALIYPFRLAWELILEAVAAVMEAIPVPAWLQNLDVFGGVDPGVVFFLDDLHVDVGVTIIISAYTIRFLIRRVPIVG